MPLNIALLLWCLCILNCQLNSYLLLLVTILMHLFSIWILSCNFSYYQLMLQRQNAKKLQDSLKVPQASQTPINSSPLPLSFFHQRMMQLQQQQQNNQNPTAAVVNMPTVMQPGQFLAPNYSPPYFYYPPQMAAFPPPPYLRQQEAPVKKSNPFIFGLSLNPPEEWYFHFLRINILS